ncbi:hypothetical protein AMK59_4621, partial [Oryctes borbonicus]
MERVEQIDYNNPQMWGSNFSYPGPMNLENITMDSNFAMLLCSLIFAISWVIYITYYNSRLVGYIITKIVNRLFIRDGYFKIGSFTLNALSGKVMFRDVAYITNDYSLRIQDGYLIFRWWRSYVPKDVSEDLSHSDTRLSVVLNGFELHVYNRSAMYFNLVHVFGLDPDILPDDAGSPGSSETNNLPTDTSTQVVAGDTNTTRKQRSEATMARTW